MSADAWFASVPEGLRLSIRVLPQPGRDQIVGVLAGRLRVRVAAPPLVGRANARLVAFLAAEFGVAKRHVRILSGERAREKRVLIESPYTMPAWFRDHAGTGAE